MAKKNNSRADALRGPEAYAAEHIRASLFIIAAVFLAYANSLNGTWALDDSAIGQFTSIGNVLNLRLGYRKIAFITFLVNTLIDPSHPLNFRITNIIIHVCNTLLLYALVFRTLGLEQWRDRYDSYRFPAAFLSGIVFGLHPVNINAVAYIVQRMTSLATFFVLLSVHSYVNAFRSAGMRAVGWYLAVLASFFLAIFSKENGILAIPLIALYDLALLRRGGLRKAWPVLVIVVLGICMLLWFLGLFSPIGAITRPLFGILCSPNTVIPPMGWTAVDVYWTPMQHMLTEIRVLARYLSLLALPLPDRLVFDWWGIQVSSGLTQPVTTIMSCLVIGGLLTAALLLTRKAPFLSFGILWYFVAISLESFVAIGSDLYFEHRNYLPVVGLFSGCIAEGFGVLHPRQLPRTTIWTMALLPALLLGVLTFQRNTVWQDSVTLWKDTTLKASENPRAYIALGNASFRASDFSLSKRSYEEAARIAARGGHAQFLNDALFSLGMVDLFTGDKAGAKRVMQMMDEKLKDSYSSAIVKAFYADLSGDPDGAIEQYNRTIPFVFGTERIIAHTLLGDTLRKRGLKDKALEQYRAAIGFDNSFPAAYYGMALTYLGMGDLGTAERYLRKTLTLEPDNVLALADMADLLLLRKEPAEKAFAYAEKAVASSPFFYQPYLSMGNVLYIMGKEDAADGYYAKARNAGLAEYMVVFSKARASFLKGDKARAADYLNKVAAMKQVPESVMAAVRKSLSEL